MFRYENDCVGCATENYPCRGVHCPYRSVKHYYCDECGEEEQLYYFDGQELCIGCIEKRLEEVK